MVQETEKSASFVDYHRPESLQRGPQRPPLVRHPTNMRIERGQPMGGDPEYRAAFREYDGVRAHIRRYVQCGRRRSICK